MERIRIRLCIGMVFLLVAGVRPELDFGLAAAGPETNLTNNSLDSNTSVLQVIRFSGVLKDYAGQPLSGVQGVTFA